MTRCSICGMTVTQPDEIKRQRCGGCWFERAPDGGETKGDAAPVRREIPHGTSRARSLGGAAR
jgi:hypothetical protein